VTTELFAVVSGLDRVTVASAVPPACWRPPDTPAPATREGGDVLIETGPWQPRCGARHFVPAFSVLTPEAYSVRFELCALVGGRWSPWVATATVGGAAFPSPVEGTPELEAQIDLWLTPIPAESVRLRLRLRAAEPAAVLGAPWLVTLSASDLAPPDTIAAAGRARLAVPPLSQVVEGGALGPRICSPTSVAMVLGYLGIGDHAGRLAAEVLHPGLDLYGVWPAAICAAGRRGVLGYLLRFPGWAAAAWCLEHGLPVIASVRYRAGELTGAAIAETSGHLLVLTGYEDGHVLVNDPAAATTAAVPRRYRQEELARVWLERAGVGYVLFKPPRPGSR
jgi:hypothetical protein